MIALAVNKVVYGTTTLVDLTKDTVSAGAMLSGTTAHDNAGNAVTGLIPTYSGENTITTDGTIPCAGMYMESDLVVQTTVIEEEKYVAHITETHTNWLVTVTIDGVEYASVTDIEFVAGTPVTITMLERDDYGSRRYVYIDGRVAGKASSSSGDFIYTFTPTSSINIRIYTTGNNTQTCYCAITTLSEVADNCTVEGITVSGNYSGTSYQQGYWAAIDAEGNLLLVVKGGTDSGYENVAFTASSVPNGVSLANQTKYSTSNATGGLYAALFTGITNNVEIDLNFNARNSSADTVTCAVTITAV